MHELNSFRNLPPQHELLQRVDTPFQPGNCHIEQARRIGTAYFQAIKDNNYNMQQQLFNEFERHAEKHLLTEVRNCNGDKTKLKELYAELFGDIEGVVEYSASKYIDSVTRNAEPVSNGVRPVINFVTGAPAVGKSTVINALPKENVVCVDQDDIIEKNPFFPMINKVFGTQWSQASEDFSRDAREVVLGSLTEDRYNIQMEGVTSSKMVKKVLDRGEKTKFHDYDVNYHVILRNEAQILFHAAARLMKFAKDQPPRTYGQDSYTGQGKYFQSFDAGIHALFDGVKTAKSPTTENRPPLSPLLGTINAMFGEHKTAAGLPVDPLNTQVLPDNVTVTTHSYSVDHLASEKQITSFEDYQRVYQQTNPAGLDNFVANFESLTPEQQEAFAIKIIELYIRLGDRINDSSHPHMAPDLKGVIDGDLNVTTKRDGSIASVYGKKLALQGGTDSFSSRALNTLWRDGLARELNFGIDDTV